MGLPPICISLRPVLHHHGPVDRTRDAPSYRGYEMVVMEWIYGKSAADLSGMLPENFIANVQDAVDRLHDIKYVFGGLRRQNIIVTVTGSS
jgi:tRNA A-37 threonylcarbamoyl transferase component Bud32